MSKKIIIIGGVAGGATAAARLRRLDESSEIIIFERGEHISFANCGLPYYVGGTIKEKDKLLVQTVKGMSQRYRLDIRTRTEVTAINRSSTNVEAINLATGERYSETYDYLILSPGASPVIPPIEGIKDNPKVFTLRTIPDAEAILNYIEESKPQTAAVVGGGFIGLEMAENLKDKGLQVFLIEATNQVQPAVDYEMACLLHSHLREKGVELILGEQVTDFTDSKVTLQSGKEIKTDMLIICVGVKPENDLAVQAGLATGAKGAIRVDEYLQTSDEAIFALGDVIEVKNYITGTPTHIPLAWPANRQGRIVADNIYGLKTAYRGTLGTSVAKVFDLTVASTGMNERLLKREGVSCKVVHIHPNSHAGYYPGASSIAMKLIFTAEGKILGAQAVGRKGVEKRIDVIATAIKGGLTVNDLPDLELAYAPPYSSGKDPVNLLGYVASNVLSGIETVQYDEIDQLVAAGNILVDVRQPGEIEKLGTIKGAINIPLPDLRERLNELPRDKTIYITCQIGLRGYLAVRILVQNGFKAVNLDGGYNTYAGVYPVAKKEKEGCEVKVDDTGKAYTQCYGNK